MREIAENEVAEATAEGLVLLDFYGTWCEPCKVMHSILEGAESEYPDVTMLKVNIEEHPITTNQHDVTLLPTLILLKDGEEVKRHMGIMNRLALKEWLKV